MDSDNRAQINEQIYLQMELNGHLILKQTIIQYICQRECVIIIIILIN